MVVGSVAADGRGVRFWGIFSGGILATTVILTVYDVPKVVRAFVRNLGRR